MSRRHPNTAPRSRSAGGLAGVEPFAVNAQEGGGGRPVVGAVAGGGGEAADQLGVDSVGLGGTAVGGAEQVAEQQVGVASATSAVPTVARSPAF